MIATNRTSPFGYKQTSGRPKLRSALPPGADVAGTPGECRMLTRDVPAVSLWLSATLVSVRSSSQDMQRSQRARFGSLAWIYPGIGTKAETGVRNGRDRAPATIQFLATVKAQGRVAFLPYCEISLKTANPKPYPTDPKTVGGHCQRRSKIGPKGGVKLVHLM